MRRGTVHWPTAGLKPGATPGADKDQARVALWASCGVDNKILQQVSLQQAAGSALRRLRNATPILLEHLLVDPLVHGTGVGDGSVLLAEPESDLLLGRLGRVRAVADVAADIDSAG